MDKSTSNKDRSAWVDEQVTSLVDTPVPEIDVPRALDQFRRMEVRFRQRRRNRVLAVVSIAAACGVLFMLPATRGIAQRLWNRLFLTGGTVVVRTSKFEQPPAEKLYNWIAPPTESSANHRVADLATAAAEAGFVPRLPAPALLDGFLSEPVLRVTASEGFEITIRVADITAGLQRAGISPADVQVPPEWDGVVIRYPGGSGVLAIYDGGNPAHRMMLSQGPVGEGILVPAGFQVDRFVEIWLRIFGLSATDARAQRNRFAANPFGFILIPPDYKGTVREVFLKSGPAILVENSSDDRNCLGCPYPGELALDWSTHDRYFSIRAAGVSQERAVEIADSLD